MHSDKDSHIQDTVLNTVSIMHNQIIKYAIQTVDDHIWNQVSKPICDEISYRSEFLNNINKS